MSNAGQFVGVIGKPWPWPSQTDHAPQSATQKQVYTFGRKIGRNEMCPCGSGVKFKKCCIDRMR